MVEQWYENIKSPPDPVAEEAKVERLHSFGILNLVDSLAAGNVLNWEKIMNLPFIVVMTKALLNREQAMFEKRYWKIKKIMDQQ